ncbi:MAG: hypothetical protein IPN39_07360 [Chitinophagaceae bacterium]|nr:hypothetical protein [Chitinophagaceae bacterium]MBL0306412.1 hypothetical protein [Chitinophagaceae bacterium]HQV60738.1 hypothetical protein [Chitinophagaceae bacterium]HQZ75573.1 hypothetical protein [Chitinophagaceae bacterium]
MKNIGLFFILLIAGYSFRSNSRSSKIPLTIVYKFSIVPDSINDFMTVYFQTKKIDVIKWEQVMTLFSEGIQAEMMSLTNSGKLNEKSAKDFIKNMPPVCNILAVTIFNDSTYSKNYLIDSIRWHVDVIPVKDTASRASNTFIPKPENKTNPYIVLKSFADNVIQSKLLK